MTTPATREEVVNAGAKAFCEAEAKYLLSIPRMGIQPLTWEQHGLAAINSQRRYIDSFSAALTALEENGIALVPTEATEQMRRAIGQTAYCSDAKPIYRAMLAASPYNKETGNG